MPRKLASLFAILAFAALLAPMAQAQWAVFDASNYANAVKEFRQLQQTYTTALQTRDQIITTYNLAYQMSRMPQNLAARYQSDFSKWTSFSSASAPDTYGNTSAWVNALDLGSPARASSAYSRAVIQVQSYPSSSLSAMDSTTQAVVQNQYASSEIGQANVTNLLSTLGTIRSDSQSFQQKLANLESDTYSTDASQQTSNALLGKVNSAALLQIHSQQDTNQILAAAAAQQALEAKEKLDERNRLINQSIYFQQNFADTMQKMTGGITQSLQSISLSPSGR
jgi:hypothetical protein